MTDQLPPDDAAGPGRPPGPPPSSPPPTPPPGSAPPPAPGYPPAPPPGYPPGPPSAPPGPYPPGPGGYGPGPYPPGPGGYGPGPYPPGPYGYGPGPYGYAPGTSGPYGVAGPYRRTNGLAVGAFVTSLVGIFPIFGIIPATVGVILGFTARSQLKRSGDAQEGAGLALAAIIIGFALLALWVVVWVVVAANTHNCGNGTYSTNC